jgi:hypothetical protein
VLIGDDVIDEHKMPGTDEHDDDLEPEVTEGAEIETMDYPDDEDLEEGQPGSGRADEQAPPDDVEEEGPEEDGSDTI